MNPPLNMLSKVAWGTSRWKCPGRSTCKYEIKNKGLSQIEENLGTVIAEMLFKSVDKDEITLGIRKELNTIFLETLMFK